MSENKIKGMLDVTMEKMRALADADTVIGTPVMAGDVTLIPVSKVSFGLATGGSDFNTKSANPMFAGGGGAGVSVTPVAFIAVSGENSSLPHGVPTDRKIRSGDFITLDFGAVVNGYRSDMTRTVAVGDVSKEQKKVYDIVLEAQEKAIEQVKEGIVCSQIDKIARDVISSYGYGEYFGHALGHSVGLDIHESPNFSPKCSTILKEGMILSVEPGIYLPQKFGVRIEDLVYVTKKGVINLTKSKKSLIIL